MDDGENLSHTKWQGKYHVVFISEVPKKDAGGWLCNRAGSKQGI